MKNAKCKVQAGGRGPKNASGTVYADATGRWLFVSDGISGGRQWGAFYRRSTDKTSENNCGSLCRVKSPRLPMRSTWAEAQADLDAYAKAEKLVMLTE